MNRSGHDAKVKTVRFLSWFGGIRGYEVICPVCGKIKNPLTKKSLWNDKRNADFAAAVHRNPLGG